MELPDAVTKILHQAVAQADELTKLQGHFFGHRRDVGSLLLREPSDPERVERVGLRPTHFLLGKPRGAHRIEQGDSESEPCQPGEEVLPVVPRRLHRDEHLGRISQEPDQLLITLSRFVERGRLDGHLAFLADRRDDVSFRADIDPYELHAPSVRRTLPRASEPVPMLTLVHARTSADAEPLDTVRAKSTGRGRLSQSRGRCLQLAAATLSRMRTSRA